MFFFKPNFISTLYDENLKGAYNFWKKFGRCFPPPSCLEISLDHISMDFRFQRFLPGAKKILWALKFWKIIIFFVSGHFWRCYTRFGQKTRENSGKTDKVQYLHGYFTDFSGYHMKRYLISAPVPNFIFWPISGQNSAEYDQK